MLPQKACPAFSQIKCVFLKKRWCYIFDLNCFQRTFLPCIVHANFVGGCSFLPLFHPRVSWVCHRALTSKSISNRWCFTLKFSALGLREGVVSWFSVWTVKSPWPSVKSPQGKSTDLCCRSFRPIPLSVYMHSHFISALIIYLAANNLKSPDRSDLSHGLCWSSAGELSTRNFFTVDGEEKWTIHLTLNLKSLPI